MRFLNDILSATNVLSRSGTRDLVAAPDHIQHRLFSTKFHTAWLERILIAAWFTVAQAAREEDIVTAVQAGEKFESDQNFSTCRCYNNINDILLAANIGRGIIRSTSPWSGRT